MYTMFAITLDLRGLVSIRMLSSEITDLSQHADMLCPRCSLFLHVLSASIELAMVYDDRMDQMIALNRYVAMMYIDVGY